MRKVFCLRGFFLVKAAVSRPAPAEPTGAKKSIFCCFRACFVAVLTVCEAPR